MTQKKIQQDQTDGLVKGPASSTDNAIARYDGVTGKLVQNSAVTISDTGGIDTTGRITADSYISSSDSVDAPIGFFNTVSEWTAASGVTIDGVLLKDGGLNGVPIATTTSTQTLTNKTLTTPLVDVINEKTADAGTTINGIKVGPYGNISAPTDITITADGGTAVVDILGTPVRANGETVATTTGTQTLTNKTLVAPVADYVSLTQPSKIMVVEEDFLRTSTPWANLNGTAISSGTLSSGAGANHPGIVGIGSSTTANSGYHIRNTNGFGVSGDQSFEAIFSIETTTGTTAYFGWHSSTSVTAPTKGAWFNIAGTTLSGKCADATTTTTASTYTIAAGTWYRGVFVLNSAKTSCTFTLYNASGTQLWTDTVAANTNPSAYTPSVCCVATNSGTTSVNLASLDYIRFTSGVLTR